MKLWKNVLSIMLLIALLSASLPTKPANAAPTYRELAEHWAPDFYHEINYAYNWKADLITNFNFDGDWNASNNWDNLYGGYSLKSYVYYSVVESQTHYFIGYYVFHPRDEGVDSSHPNDMEGTLLVIRKDGSTYGKFQLMETFAHYLFFQYTNDSNITKGKADLDGGVQFNGHRPKVYIEPNGATTVFFDGKYSGGHGHYAYLNQGATDAGIVYYYGGTASQVTSKPTGKYTQRYSYDLLNITELFSRRESSSTYPDFNKSPWGWDMSKTTNKLYGDGETYRGDFLADPAHLVDTHLNGLGTFSHSYVYNPYATHIITVSDVTSLHDGDLTTASDIYIKLTVDGEPYMSHGLWKYNDAAINSKKSVYFGKNHASDGNQYSESYRTRYIVRPKNSSVRFEIMDYDDTGSDSLGYKSTSPAPGNSVTWTDTITSSSKAKFTATIQATNN